MNPHLIQRTTGRATATLAAVALLLTAGCADMNDTQRGTAAGAGIGAAAGAVLGSATGNRAGGSAVVGGVIGAVVGNLWSKRMEERKQAMEQATHGTGIEVSRTADDQLKLNVPNDISFDVGSAAVKPQLRTVLDTFATSLQGDTHARIEIVGHTDSTGSEAINNPLSVERAQAVRDYLAGRGVSPTRIQTAGHGEREPVADNATEAGRARNRRVEVFLREPAPS